MKKLKESEHLVLATKLDKNLTDEEMIELRYFKPAFLSTNSQNEDNFNKVLKTL